MISITDPSPMTPDSTHTIIHVGFRPLYPPSYILKPLEIDEIAKQCGKL